jgi:hypothetical protein
VVHADHRNPARERERFPERHAHEQRADESGPVGHGDRVDVVRTESASARSTTGTIAVRCARDAISGTTRRICDARLRENHQRADAHVVAGSLEDGRRRPSQDVSMPRIRVTLRRRGRRSGTGIDPTRMTFTCDGFTRSVDRCVDVDTCGSESGKVMTVRIVRTVFTYVHAVAAPTPARLRIEPRRDRPGDAGRVTESARRRSAPSASRRLEAKRDAARLTSRTTASTPWQGDVIGAQVDDDRVRRVGPAGRRIAGGLTQPDELLRRAQTIACISGTGSRSTSELSSGVKRMRRQSADLRLFGDDDEP